MNILVVIPARGGSKGLPGKNIKDLCGKPLITYSIDVARGIVPDCDICVSTDDQAIIDVVENYGLKVPFVRPAELATDTATSNDVLMHAYNYYIGEGRVYDAILLLQPTSPLRTIGQVNEALLLYKPSIDMVVSVKESHAASVICNDDENGYLTLTLNKKSLSRQQADKYYEYNGAIYVINPESLTNKGLSGFSKTIKYVMPEKNSIDIDTLIDWQLATFILNEK